MSHRQNEVSQRRELFIHLMHHAQLKASNRYTSERALSIHCSSTSTCCSSNSVRSARIAKRWWAFCAYAEVEAMAHRAVAVSTLCAAWRCGSRCRTAAKKSVADSLSQAAAAHCICKPLQAAEPNHSQLLCSARARLCSATLRLFDLRHFAPYLRVCLVDFTERLEMLVIFRFALHVEERAGACGFRVH